MSSEARSAAKIGGRRDRTESAANAAGDLNPARYTTPGAPSVPRGDAAGLRRPRLLSPHLPRGPVGRCGKPVDAEGRAVDLPLLGERRNE